MHPIVGVATDGAGQRRRRTKRAAEADLPQAAQESDFGLCPPGKTVDLWCSDSTVVHLGRFRKALRMYLEALTSTGSVEVLQAAKEFADSSLEWQGKKGYWDLKELAKGNFVLGLLGAAVGLCPLEDLLPPGSEQDGQGAEAALFNQLRTVAAQLEAARAEPVLQRAYDLWASITVKSDKGSAEWESEVLGPARSLLLNTAAAAAAVSGEGAAQTWLPHADVLTALAQRRSACEAVLQAYAHLHVHALAAWGATEKLRAIAQPLKGRFRSPSLASGEAKKIVTAVGCAWAESLQRDSSAAIERARGLVPAASTLANTVPIALPQPTFPAVAPMVAPGMHAHQPVMVPQHPLGLPAYNPALNAALSPAMAQQIEARAIQLVQERIPLEMQHQAAAGGLATPDALRVIQERLYSAALAEVQQSMLYGRTQMGPGSPLMVQQSTGMVPTSVPMMMVPVNDLGAVHHQSTTLVPVQQVQSTMVPQQTNNAAASVATPEELETVDAVLTALQKVQTFFNSVPWVHDSAAPQQLKDAAAKVEELLKELLRCHAALSHTESPPPAPASRKQAIRVCGELVKSHRRGSKDSNQGRSSPAKRSRKEDPQAVGPSANTE